MADRYSNVNELGEPMIDGAALRFEAELDNQAAAEGMDYDDDYYGRSGAYDLDYDPEYDIRPDYDE